MDIIVCIKRVPDTETRVKIAADGASLDPSGVQYIVAPYDEIAIQKAVEMKGDGTVTVVTVGPPEATKELRSALAMGADEAVHAPVEDAGDASATAEALHQAIGERSFDLILCGKQATDDDDAAVGPMLAARLGLPCVTFADGLDVEDGKLRVRRDIEGESEVLEVDGACVVTAQKGLAEPKIAGLKGIMAAKKKPLETVEVSLPPSKTTVRSMALPPARDEVRLLEPTEEGVRTLLEALRNDKKVI